MASAVEEEEFTVDLCKVIQGPKDTPRLLCTFGFVPDSGVSPILINVNGTQLDPGLLLTQEGIAGEHDYISSRSRIIEFSHGSQVIRVMLYLIFVRMNEQYEVQSAGAQLGEHGDVIIATENVKEGGDAIYESALSKGRSE